MLILFKISSEKYSLKKKTKTFKKTDIVNDGYKIKLDHWISVVNIAQELGTLMVHPYFKILIWIS